MTGQSIDKLISITKKKNQLLQNIYALTNKQNKAIEDEDMEDLDKNLDKKDGLMKEIDKLDLSFMTIFSQIKREHSIADINELDVKEFPNLLDLKKVVKEISSTLMAISLLDEKNTESIKKRLESTKEQLKILKKGKKAYKGYNPSPDGSILIDEKK